MSLPKPYNSDKFPIPVFEDLNAEPTKREIISAIYELQSRKSYESLIFYEKENLRELSYNELETIYKETLTNSKKHIKNAQLG